MKKDIKIKVNNEYHNNCKEEKCPSCSKKLSKRHEGLVCRNHKCGLYFKLEKGWIYLNGQKKNNLNYFKDRYDFDIERFENTKKWLRKKIEILHKRGRKCEICSSEISLQVHHIILRSENPILTFDDENLMVLCKECHKKMHSKDKWRFS